MGVIKIHDSKLGMFASDSEESLQIPTSEDEGTSSASSIVALPPTSTRVLCHLPVPMSVSTERKNIGKKKFRRFENVNLLETLVEGEELQAVSIYDFIPERSAGFKSVLENEEAKEKWENFISSNEDQQQHIVGDRNITIKQSPSALPMTPDEAFRNIKTGLRNILKRSQLPLGMIEFLETKLVEFFTNTPKNIFISEHLSSFERLLLHGVARYYSLRSLSFDSERDNTRLVRISNPHEDFHQPSMLLVEFLMERRKGSLLHNF